MNTATQIFLWLFLWIPGASTQDQDRDQIMGLLGRQVECWNKGDLECFMEAYWKSDSVKYIGSKGITYGWGNTLKRYQKNYPSLEAMGHLEFTIISTERVGSDGFFQVGRYYLKRAGRAEASGYFSLLWRKINGNWRIVSDHSS